MSEIGTKIFGLSKPRLAKKTWQGIEIVIGEKSTETVNIFLS